jgi:hypothetical protein
MSGIQARMASSISASDGDSFSDFLSTSIPVRWETERIHLVDAELSNPPPEIVDK